MLPTLTITSDEDSALQLPGPEVEAEPDALAEAEAEAVAELSDVLLTRYEDAPPAAPWAAIGGMLTLLKLAGHAALA